jgi:cytochrome c
MISPLLSFLALALLLIATALPARAQGDVTKGQQVFNKCKICHEIGDGAKPRVGPPLNNIFGRTAGTMEGFSYSTPMKKAGEEGLVWTEEQMSDYLENPRQAVPGTKMIFPGLKKDSDRDNVIAYLKRFSTPQ